MSLSSEAKASLRFALILVLFGWALVATNMARNLYKEKQLWKERSEYLDRIDTQIGNRYEQQHQGSLQKTGP